MLIIKRDRFEPVNNAWGQAAGNDVLISLARVVQQKLRGADMTFRWNGEAFLALMPGSNRKAAAKGAERLHNAVQTAEIASTDGAVRITISIGVAEVRDDDRDPAAVVDRADCASSAARRDGGNQVRADPTM